MYKDNSLGRKNRQIRSHQKSLEKAIVIEETKKRHREWMQIKQKIAHRFKTRYKIR